MILRALAPAKVNLYLHVAPPVPEGWHPVASLMVFADVGDEVAVQAAEDLTLAIEGPFGEGLSCGPDNLVLRAAQALAAAGGVAARARLTLTKALPVASGLGGGSSDAGAAFRLLRRLWGLTLDDAGLQAVAEVLGADGAACLWGRSVLAEGKGERLTPAPILPPLPAVLVNPGLPSPTGAVYRAYDDAGALGRADLALPPTNPDVAETAAWLATCRNDLQGPAVTLEPRIGEALAVLAAAPQTLLARMSGSGATCFALCATDEDARALAAALAAEHPVWWARACRLGGGA